jgi:oligopeptide/dipeptide ABC transporter ATP-binding protein
MNPLLAVQDLRVTFPGSGNEIAPVDGVTFSIDPGETLALVGESGSGKTLTSLALVRLVPPPGRIAAGSIRFGGTDLLALAPASLRQVRGRRIGMVFQDPMTSLNPVLSVGDQISETIRAHFPASRAEARRRSEALLLEVGLGDSAGTYKSYPHQLSGGMRQRAMLAIALAGEPELLVADEPTSALDVTIQAQILALLDQLKASHRMSVLLISHDLGVVAGRSDRVAVMYAGRIVEEAPTARLFASPAHPYTRGLLASLPRLRGPRRPLQAIPGVVPRPEAWPAGCRFHPRCSQAMPHCTTEPPIVAVSESHRSRCWLGVERA